MRGMEREHRWDGTPSIQPPPAPLPRPTSQDRPEGHGGLGSTRESWHMGTKGVARLLGL